MEKKTKDKKEGKGKKGKEEKLSLEIDVENLVSSFLNYVEDFRVKRT